MFHLKPDHMIVMIRGLTRGFIIILSRRVTGFYRQEKLFELNFFIRKRFH